MSFIQIKEVGPRDGLQNEKRLLATKDKIQLVESLADCGLTHIEVTSFVPKTTIPQLADAEDVFANVTKKEHVVYSCLVPNMKGLERAKRAGAKEVAVFISCSETHNAKNVNKTIENSMLESKEIIAAAAVEKIKVRAYLSMVFGCPYEGAISTTKVQKLAFDLLDYGAYEISLGDTIGIANPKQIQQFFRQWPSFIDKKNIALHFHNTYGLALTNIYEALFHEIKVFDSSIGGLGGCPFARGASGNVATEDVVYFLHQLGLQTNIDEKKLYKTSSRLEKLLKKSLSSSVFQANKHK